MSTDGSGAHEASINPNQEDQMNVPMLDGKTCPEREAHGKPFRFCPVKRLWLARGDDR